jgi:hypothetical protein
MRGVHRIKNSGYEDGVWVTDGSNGFEIPESLYQARGYEPSVETLRWESTSGLLRT